MQVDLLCKDLSYGVTKAPLARQILYHLQLNYQQET